MADYLFKEANMFLITKEALEELINVAARHLTYAQCAPAIDNVKKNIRPFDERKIKADGFVEIYSAAKGNTYETGTFDVDIDTIAQKYIEHEILPATLPIKKS